MRAKTKSRRFLGLRRFGSSWKNSMIQRLTSFSRLGRTLSTLDTTLMTMVTLLRTLVTALVPVTHRLHLRLQSKPDPKLQGDQ